MTKVKESVRIVMLPLTLLSLTGLLCFKDGLGGISMEGRTDLSRLGNDTHNAIR